MFERNPVAHEGVFRYLARDGGMHNVPGRVLLEDVIGHGLVEDLLGVCEVGVAFLGKWN